jgi:hypothetical protein
MPLRRLGSHFHIGENITLVLPNFSHAYRNLGVAILIKVDMRQQKTDGSGQDLNLQLPDHKANTL